MCAADTTLEALRPEGKGVAPSVDGWGTVHQCADYNAVYSWAEVHRASDDGGIL